MDNITTMRNLPEVLESDANNTGSGTGAPNRSPLALLLFRCGGTIDKANCSGETGRLEKVWRRGSESNRRMQLLQSRALPLGYPANKLQLAG